MGLRPATVRVSPLSRCSPFHGLVHLRQTFARRCHERKKEKSPRKPGGVRRGAVHSMRASAQVTAPGAVTSMIVAMSTRPNDLSAHRPLLPTSQTRLADCQGRNRGSCVNCFTLRVIIVLMETIKDLYFQARTSTAIRPLHLRLSA
jgi:hypothetical protein